LLDWFSGDGKMKTIVKDFILKHNLFTKDATILVGVSGGPDSMALLHYLHSLKDEWNFRVVAISVDHQLRGEESLRDLRYVENVCKQWKVEFIGKSVDVPSWKKEKKQGTQVAARTLRYAIFEQQMEQLGANYLALGHHGDDQAETMLMRLTRSADSQALVGIPVKRAFAGGSIVRPFLCVTKEDIWNYCEAHNITPRLDPSNEETTYTRNYVRHHILPLLKEKNSNLHTTIQHLSETLAIDQAYITEEAENMVHSVVQFDQEKQELSFEIDQFKTYAFALQRRAYHLILNYLYIDLPKDLSYVHEEQFFALLHRQTGNAQIDFPAGLKVEKSYNQLRCHFCDDLHCSSSFHKHIKIPGKTILPDGSAIIAKYVDAFSEETKDSFCFDASQVALPLHIRTRKHGDKMHLKGLNGSKKVKDIFIDAKVPRRKRAIWPIITDDHGEILWLVGLRKASLAKRSTSTSQIQLYYEKCNM
jgi:tRNA(Ile)-lysidine synthase